MNLPRPVDDIYHRWNSNLVIHFNTCEYIGEGDPVFKKVPWNVVDITPPFVSSVKAGASNILKKI